MTDSRQQHTRSAWHFWKGPAVVWLALIVLLAASFSSAYLPLGAGNVAVNLVIAALMIVLLATFLMDLANATALVRIVAAAGLFWTIFMFALTFNDYLTRYY